MTNFDKLQSMSKEEYLKWLNSEFIDYEEIEKKHKAEQDNCPYCTVDNNLNCYRCKKFNIYIGRDINL